MHKTTLWKVTANNQPLWLPPAPEPSYRRGLVRDQAKPATQAETAVLAENPDLSQYHRESPEAALDLLRLIREAAKKQ